MPNSFASASRLHRRQRVRLIILGTLLGLLCACGAPLASAPAPTSRPATATSAPTPTATPTPGATTRCQQQLDGFCVGIEAILDGELYAVHSYFRQDGVVANTVAIFVIRGPDNQIYIAGTGYGTLDDAAYYRNQPAIETENAAARDAQDVDTIITQWFGLSRNQAQVDFIVTNWHLDHINQEFLTALFALGYNLRAADIIVHATAVEPATCNAPCCGNTPCDNSSPFFGAPYADPWTPATLRLFRTIGAVSDTCNQPIESFAGAARTWTIIKAEDRPGTNALSLIDNSARILLQGSAHSDNCPPPEGYTIYRVHGDFAPQQR